MKFLFYSSSGDSLSLAQRVEMEGNDVTFLLASPNEKSEGVPGRGIVRRVVMGPLAEGGARGVEQEIRKRADRDTILVLDMVSGKKFKSGPAADALRADGYPLVGGGAFNDAIELDRTFGTHVMRLVGIDVPDTMTFVEFKGAIEFAKAHPTFLVFKPHGNVDTAKTTVSDDVDSFVKALEAHERHWKGKVEFELQEKVDGIEVSVEGWFDGHNWIHKSFNSTIEEKAFLTGGLGPKVGCMGNVVWFWQHARPRIVKDTLLKLTPVLRRQGYRGPLDINVKGGRGLEFTARFGYDAIQALVHLFDQEIGKTLSDIARGQARAWKVNDSEYAGAVRLSVPPYPGEHKVEESAGELVHVPSDVAYWFHPGDVEVKDGDLVTSGHDGVVGVVTAVAPGLGELDKVLYDRVRRVRVNDVQYRTDIVTYRAKREVPTLLREVVT